MMYGILYPLSEKGALDIRGTLIGKLLFADDIVILLNVTVPPDNVDEFCPIQVVAATTSDILPTLGLLSYTVEEIVPLNV